MTTTDLSTAPLAGAAALVYGGTAGIGFACAQKFAAAGAAHVTLVGRDPERGAVAAARLSASHPHANTRFVAGDAATPEGAAAGVDAAIGAAGRLDVMLSSAGGAPMPKIFHKMAMAEIRPTLDMLVMGAILPARAALPTMMAQGSGVILTVASDAAKIATPGESVIGAAMAAIVMFTRGLAIEAKRSGVRANCLTPSIVRDTPQYERLMADEFSQKLFGKAEKLAALGVVAPDDLAELALFLASPAAARITGQAISANGGVSAA